MKTLPPFTIPAKIRLLFALFGLFLAGNRAWSQVKESKPKFDIYFFTQAIPSQLSVKKIVSSTFQFAQSIFQKNLNSDFRVWLLLVVPRIHLFFKKK